MTHLDDEQLDRIPADPSASAHLSECESCRRRLAGRQALRDRLARAFLSVQPPPDLAGRIAASLDNAAPAVPQAPVMSRSRRRAVLHYLWPALAAAAALLAAATPLVVYLVSGEPAIAELARIHEQNLTHGHELFASDDPAELADYFRQELGFAAEVPQLGQGMSMRGCCVSQFRGAPVGSYVVDTPKGYISIIVLSDTPKDLNRGGTLIRDQRTYLLGTFARNRTAAVRIGPYTYCAVGQAEQAWLVDLLEQLLPA